MPYHEGYRAVALAAFNGSYVGMEYCRVGVPLTVVTILIGWLILIVVPV